MNRIKLTIQSLNIPFKLAFSHASAERSRTQSVLVTASSTDGITGYGEACPREYVTGETMVSVMGFFTKHHDEVSRLPELAALRQWVTDHQLSIDANPSAWCAMEMALLDLLAKQQQQSLEKFLGLEELAGAFRYSAILGTDSVSMFDKLLSMYLDIGMTDFKIKLMGNMETDRKKVALLKQYSDKNIQLRFDANNYWNELAPAYVYLQALEYPFWAVEEPLTAGHYEDLSRLANLLGTKIILDESFSKIAQFDRLLSTDECWIINLRVSKMGGLLRSLAIVDKAINNGVPMIVGSQVGETSLLTRAGLLVAQAAKECLQAQEGAFGTYLLQYDICKPSLMFGRGGMLEPAKFAMRANSGYGLQVTAIA